MVRSSSLSPLGIVLAWVPAAVAAFVALSLAVDPVFGLLGLAGPAGLLAFKPAPLSVGRVGFALVTFLPLIAGAVLLARLRDRPGRLFRVLIVVGLSIYWHGSAVVLWVLALSGLN